MCGIAGFIGGLFGKSRKERQAEEERAAARLTRAQ